MHFDHLSQPPTPSRLSSTSLITQLHGLFPPFLKTIWSPVVLANYSQGWGLPWVWCGRYTRYHNTPQLVPGTSWPPSPLPCGILSSSCVLPSQSLRVHICIRLTVARTKCLPEVTHQPLTFRIPLLPLLHESLSFGGEYDIAILFRTNHSKASYSLCIDWLWVSVLIVIYCKKKHLWWEFSSALIYGHQESF